MVGRTLGHYEIIEPLGVGGMGEVYLAEDTRLGRKVAIKVLPAEFASDPQRLARFEQEARAAAALNHPHIAVVHDVGAESGEDGTTTHFMVQEYLEGSTLREILKPGALPLKKALAVATELSEALAAAHEGGIVHRDLKPENIFITKDGHAKVLDFGLAKLTEIAESSGSQLSMSPTMLGTVAGQVMGTAGYMAPEQAEGRSEIDQRADLFAFGCVVYELVTGRQPFTGRSVAETLAQIQHDEPPQLGEIDTSLPVELQRITKKCLAKEASQRYQTAGDLGVDLRSLAADVEAGRTQTFAVVGRAGRPAKGGIAAAAALGLVVGFSLAAVLWGGSGSQTTRAPVSWLSIPLPPELTTPYVLDNYPNRMMAISPDGSRIAFVSGSSGEPLLHIRELDDLTLRAIPGTESAYNPFFSPAGDFICFFTEDGELKKVSLAEGSEPLTVARGIGNSMWAFGSWDDNGTIIYSTFYSGFFAVPQEGGTPVPTGSLPGNEAYQDPQILPGSRAVLFYASRAESTAVQTMLLHEANAVPTTLIEDASHPVYLASGHILYVQEGRLRARPFDLEALAFTGPAFSVPLDVAFDYLGAYDPTPQLAVSRNGTLVYAPARAQYGRQTELVWVDRDGTAEAFATLDVWRPRFQLSPDNRRLALEYRVGSEVLISLYDMERRVLESTLARKRTVAGGQPVWTPDGSEIITSHPGTKTSSMGSIRADGSAPEAEIFRQAASWLFPFGLSADGKRLAYSYFRNDTGGDIGVYEFGEGGSEGEIIEFLATDEDEDTPRISPDGRLIAYVDHSGAHNEIYVKPYPPGETRRITTASGYVPLWSPDGKELFFQKSNWLGNTTASGSGTELWVVSIETEPELSIGTERMLFSGPLYQGGGDSGYGYDVSNDGRRFLMAKRDLEDLQVSELIVVQNWFEELRGRERAGR